MVISYNYPMSVVKYCYLLFVQWTAEDSDELPGWYKAQVQEYFAGRSCKIVYSGNNDCKMSEIVDLNAVEWKPCLRKFVHLNE